VVFDISSMENLIKKDRCWPIEIKTDTKLRGAMVGVVGLFNKGKTFFVNRLGETEVPTGTTVSTRGLSIIKPTCQELQDLVFVDSAGSGSPVITGAPGVHRDKKVIEDLVSGLLFTISEFYIVMVNDLTWKDQDLISKLQERIRLKRKQMRLFVVHNLVHTTVETFAAQKAQIKKYYPDGKDVGLHKYTSSEKKEHTVVVLEHFFLVNETNDPASKEFNDQTFALIRGVLKNAFAAATVTERDVVESVYAAVKSVLFNYIELDPRPEEKEKKLQGDEEKCKLDFVLEKSHERVAFTLKEGWSIKENPQFGLTGLENSPDYSVSFIGRDYDNPEEFTILIEGPLIEDAIHVEIRPATHERICYVQGKKFRHPLESYPYQMAKKRKNIHSEFTIPIPIPKNSTHVWPLEKVCAPKIENGICVIRLIKQGHTPSNPEVIKQQIDRRSSKGAFCRR